MANLRSRQVYKSSPHLICISRLKTFSGNPNYSGNVYLYLGDVSRDGYSKLSSILEDRKDKKIDLEEYNNRKKKIDTAEREIRILEDKINGKSKAK